MKNIAAPTAAPMSMKINTGSIAGIFLRYDFLAISKKFPL